MLENNIVLYSKINLQKQKIIKLEKLKYFDKKYNVDFSIIESGDKLGNNQFHGYGYEPSYPINTILLHYNITQNDNIVDLGSGKGYALHMFCKYSFGKICGVECNKNLFDISVNNLSKLHPNDTRIELFCEDVMNWEYFGKFNYFYLFNPFDEYVVGYVASCIKNSADERKKQVIVIYQAPKHKDVFLKYGFVIEISCNINMVLRYEPRK